MTYSLTRAGYLTKESINTLDASELNEYSVELIVTQENQDKSAHDELMQDFMSLVASFSGRFYSLRGHENARKLLKEAESRLS